MWGGVPHAELPELFSAVASDRDNRVVILTGTGDTFIGMTGTHFGPDLIDPEGWDRILYEGLRLVNELLDIDVPMIAAVNGPAIAHSELAVLCDVVLCSDNAYFQDAAHIPGGLLPGDSMQIIWPMLIGHNRGRTFLLTGQRDLRPAGARLGRRRRGPPARPAAPPRRGDRRRHRRLPPDAAAGHPPRLHPAAQAGHARGPPRRPVARGTGRPRRPRAGVGCI